MKKRKAEGEAAAGQQLEKKRKVTGEVGTAKTSGSKAAGPKLPGTSDPVVTAAIIASPQDGHIGDQKPAELSKDTASAEESSVSADASKDTASAEESSGPSDASKDMASAKESSGSPVAPGKDRVVDPKSSASKAAGPELPGTTKGDTPDPSASKAAGPELPGAVTGDITDSDKGKAAGPELCGTSKKRSAIEAGLEEKSEVKKTRRVPVGLLNHHRACFANAVTRCLQGTAPINGYYRKQAKGVLPTVANCGVTEGDLRSMGSNTRKNRDKKSLVRTAFDASTEQISLSAYFGQLCERMSTATESSVSPFLFQQAFGTRFKNDSGEEMNGDRSEDSFQFLTTLLLKLGEEELESRTNQTEKPTVVSEVFGVKTAKDSICQACGHASSRTDDALWLDTSVPDQKEPLPFEECFSSFEGRTRQSDYKCDHCKELGSTDTSTSIATGDYLILNANRTDYNTGKIHTKVTLPNQPITLSAPFPQDAKYEVYGVVQHHGHARTDGHYTALLKIDGQWWNLDDQKASKITDADLDKYKQQRGCQFFLRRVPS